MFANFFRYFAVVQQIATVAVCLLLTCEAADALPAVSSGTVLFHLDADAANVALGPGNVVTQWNDASGGGNNFFQTDPARQPLWVANDFNGHSVIRFDGNSDWLDTGTGINSANRTPFTFFAVTRNTADPFALFDSAPLSQNTFRFGSFGGGAPSPIGRNAVEFWDRSPVVPLSVHNTGSVVSLTGYRSGANRVLEVRELSQAGTYAPPAATGNANPVLFGTATNNPTIGTINKGQSGAVATPFYYSGDIAEMITYNGQLSAVDRAAVENYLRERYALEFVPPPTAIPSGLGNYGRTVLAASPAAFWRLETNNSPPVDSADAAGFPQHGAQNGIYQDFNAFNLAQPGPRPTDMVGGRPLVGFAADNKAADFQGNTDGGNDVALFADDGNLNLAPTAAFTIEAWVKGPAAQEIGSAIVAKGIGTREQFTIDVVNNQYRFYVRNGGNPDAATVLQTPVGPNDTWQHVAAVFDSGEGVMKLYVNGVDAGGTPTSALPPTIIDNLHDISVGSRQSGSSAYDFNFDGLIDEVAVYAYPLAASDINAHFEAAFVPEPSSLALVALALASAGAAGWLKRRRR